MKEVQAEGFVKEIEGYSGSGTDHWHNGEQMVGSGYKARGQKEQIRSSDLGAESLQAAGFGGKLF